MPTQSALSNTDQRAALVHFLEHDYGVNFSDPTSPASLAVDWLLGDAKEITYDTELAQRFALVALDFGLTGNFSSNTQPVLNWGVQNQYECDWRGVICNNEERVVELRFGGLELSGSICPEVFILKNLRYIDFSDNQIVGSIPEELYELTLLESVYLYQNQLTGRLSSRLGFLDKLRRFHLSHNALSGFIPETIKTITSLRKSPERLVGSFLHFFLRMFLFCFQATSTCTAIS
jgi:Leucine-rich repeat (LRR) protein